MSKMDIYDDSVAFWFNDHLVSLLSDLSQHTNTKDSKYTHEVWSLQCLAKSSYLDYLFSLFDESHLAEEFDERVEEIYKREKDFVYFMGDFFRRYIQEAETVVSDDSDSDDSDGSIVLDFYPSSDESD